MEQFTNLILYLQGVQTLHVEITVRMDGSTFLCFVKSIAFPEPNLQKSCARHGIRAVLVMKKILLTLLLTVSALASWAYDFSAVAPSGQTLYYNITTDSTVSVTHPSSSSGSNAWYGYTKPTDSLTIPTSVSYSSTTYAVTYIDDLAFYNCSGLTSVVIPNSVTSIGGSVFAGCSGLTSVTIPNSVTSIGNSVFNGCSGLTSVTIPNSVTSIGNYAFRNCSGLTSVTIPNSVTSIGIYAFEECTGLTSVIIPNSVTSIDYDAFYNCSGLTSVIIPNSVTSIGNSAFDGCSGLTFIVIGNSVTSIGARAFYNCFSVDTIISHATAPPTLGSNAFGGLSPSAVIVVPCGRSMQYYASWSFTDIVESSPYVISATSANDAQGAVSSSNISCSSFVLTALPSSGYNFDHWNDNSTINPRIVTLTQDTSFVAYFVSSAQTIHDTIYVDRWHHDTTYLHDTTIVNRYIHDTTIVDRWQYDTTYIHDTTYVDRWQYDTTYIDNYIHDTIFLDIDYHHLSVISGNPSRGLVAGNGDFPTGSQVEIAAIPIHGSWFVSWQDGNTDNPRSVTLDNDLVFVASFDELEGIANTQPTDYTISTQGNRMVISGVADKRVRIFDAVGRLLGTAQGHNDVAVFQAPAMGVYLVQVDDSPAQRVVLR